MIYIEEELYWVFKRFLERVGELLRCDRAKKMNEKYYHWPATEDWKEEFKEEDRYIDRQNIDSLTWEILEKYDKKITDVYPFMDDPWIDEDRKNVVFTVEIGDTTDQELFKILSNEEYSDYTDEIEKRNGHIKLEKIELEKYELDQGSDPTRFDLCFNYKVFERIRPRTKDKEGKYTQEKSEVETQRVRLDMDLYKAIMKIREELRKKRYAELTEKQILNLIVAEKVICHTKEEFESLIEQVLEIVQNWG